MEYGSIFGHGAYLGPDWTADYLHRAAEAVARRYGGDDAARARAAAEFKVNRYDEATGTLTISAAQAATFTELSGYYHAQFSAPEPAAGCGAAPSPIPTTPAGSPASSPGRPGRRRPSGRARAIPTPATGRRSAWSATSRPPTR
jgi:hypothetical protein